MKTEFKKLIKKLRNKYYECSIQVDGNTLIYTEGYVGAKLIKNKIVFGTNKEALKYAMKIYNDDIKNGYSTIDEILEKKIEKDKEERKKKKKSILAIPYFKSNGKIFFVNVKDKKTNEWTFISGTVEEKESYNEAIKRELVEETKQCINFYLSDKNHKKFKIIYFDGKVVKNYKVYFLDIGGENNIINCFKNSKLKDKKFNENVDISINTLDEFKNKHIWSFISEVMNNKEFKKIYKNL